MAAEMFSYGVTATGEKGFQVSVTHLLLGTRLIDDFCSLSAAETFADQMRMIDATPAHRGVDQR
jgi:hypothetical protein